VAGKWERSKWEGVELHGKTLGVVGLGRIGALVAQRALAFGMRLCAYDPYVSADRARHMGVELMALDELVAEADFITIHLPKTAETAGLFGRDLLAKAKPGLRIVNAAEAALSMKKRWPKLCETDAWAEPPSTSSPPNRAWTRRCSVCPTSSSPPTSAHRQPKPRTRPA